jgi:hypothetical protein
MNPQNPYRKLLCGAASLRHKAISRAQNSTALFKRVRYIVFVESLALRGSQQKLWFYLSVK